MAGSKRKLEDLNPRKSELGNYLTEKSLPDEVNSHRLATFRKCVGDLSEYEAEIKRRILSYEIELKESNYGLVAERLREDQYPAFVYKNEWDAILSPGLTYKDSHSFIEIEKNIRGNERAEKKLIVDLQFQSQFPISLCVPSSPAYLNIWNSLPNIFVGTEEKLRKIITIICSAAEEPNPEFLEPNFLQSKWLSPNRKLHQ